MSLNLRRRHFLAASLGGAASLGLPLNLQAAMRGEGFTHGVASGEPGPTCMLLWTRYASPSDEVELSWQIAEDAGMGRVVAEGTALASTATGHCAKAEASGLDPARWYFYRFRAPNGDTSMTGRTRTLPASGLDPFAMAVFSCSNLPYGYFNAYAHAAERDGIHLAVHLGDYIYEYPRGTYPEADKVVGGRAVDPVTEIVSLEDYHTRYALYRSDPDLQRLHQVLPMISIWDDHEFTNDAWQGGAENHQPETEGNWDVRKRTAMAAYRHWLPMSDDPWKAYEIGDLATLFRLDTRISGRDKQIDLMQLFMEAGSLEAGLAKLRNEVWIDPTRHLLGDNQERWLEAGMAESVQAGKRWQVLAQQVVMGSTYTPAAVTEWIDPASPAQVTQRVQAAVALAEVGIPANLDAWGGYPAARARLLRSAQEANANLVVLAGDSHNSWAFNLAEGERPAGVEFGFHSVTSPGFEAYFTRTDPQVIAASLVEGSSELRWADTSGRGYGVVTLDADAARSDYVYVDTVKAKSLAALLGQSVQTQRGTNQLELV
ncbi:MAG: alkaline phosphatase D family protein [Pacificimonas sp.]|jgi:alkaline phosphatase D|nr:alkaline phosphatase D family protein [Pacificimonas sp.]